MNYEREGERLWLMFCKCMAVIATFFFAGGAVAAVIAMFRGALR